MSERKVPGNPFRYGREAEVLVDRDEELARVVRIGEECGTLFLIGPRRFVFGQRRHGLADPLVDELASIPLNLWAQERGYIKLHPNLLGM